ncbi:MAG: hypothetical protein F9K44_03615 [Hyphomicrobiaceae bacterium]|nr:MAG: hypothetical protein F9K44_03615 [Hyphomicrobiaceae bacterium]
MRSGWLWVAAVGLVAALALASGTRSLKAVSTTNAPEPRYEVVVFEAAACRYCALFRQTLGERYLASTTNSIAPMRFVDATREDKDPDGLKVPISILPTIVLMISGREVDRLEGYPAPEALFHMIRSRTFND